MTNPQFGTPELAAAQEQPEVLVNAADRALSAAMAGAIDINFPSDDDHVLQASTPVDAGDEWAFGTIRMTDTEVVLTAPRDVIYPDVDTLYGGPSRARFIFANDTQQTLTIRREGDYATGVSVAPGQSKLVRHDGDDIVEVAAAGSGSGPVVIQVAASQAGEELQQGASVAYFRAAHAFSLTDLRASVLVAAAMGYGDIEITVRRNGAPIATVTIDEGDKTSTASETPANITSAAIADDDEITIDIDDAGAGAESLIVTLIGAAT